MTQKPSLGNPSMDWGTPADVRHLLAFHRRYGNDVELSCPRCGHDVDHTTPCPEGCPACPDRESVRQEWYRLRRDTPSDPRVRELEALL